MAPLNVSSIWVSAIFPDQASSEMFYITTGVFVIPAVCLSGIITNVFNLVILSMDKANSANISLLNLATADLQLCVMAIFLHLEHVFVDEAAKADYYLVRGFLFAFTAVVYQAIYLFYFKVSIERFVAIAFPIKAKFWMTYHASVRISVGLWVFAFITVGIYFVNSIEGPFYKSLHSEESHSGASMVRNSFNLTSGSTDVVKIIKGFLLDYFLFIITPLRIFLVALVGMCTIYMSLELRKQSKRRKLMAGDGNSTALTETEWRNVKVAVGIGCLMGVYFVNAIFHMMTVNTCQRDPFCNAAFFPFFHVWTSTIYICNCSANFFLYMALNEKFRQAFFQLGCQCCRRA